MCVWLLISKKKHLPNSAPNIILSNENGPTVLKSCLNKSLCGFIFLLKVIGRVQISEHGDKKESDHWSEIQASTNQNTSLEWWHQLKCIDKVH